MSVCLCSCTCVCFKGGHSVSQSMSGHLSGQAFDRTESGSVSILVWSIRPPPSVLTHFIGAQTAGHTLLPTAHVA